MDALDPAVYVLDLVRLLTFPPPKKKSIEVPEAGTISSFCGLAEVGSDVMVVVVDVFSPGLRPLFSYVFYSVPSAFHFAPCDST